MSFRIDEDAAVQPRCRRDDVDPDWWIEPDIPEGEAAGSIAAVRSELIRAQLYCYDCPLIAQCRAESWDEPAHVWGGLTYGERFKARQVGEVQVGQMRPIKDRSARVLAKVRRQYLSGDSTDDIAATMDLSVERVRYHIRTLLIQTRTFRERELAWGNPPPPFKATMTQAAYRAGLGSSDDSLRDSA